MGILFREFGSGVWTKVYFGNILKERGRFSTRATLSKGFFFSRGIPRKKCRRSLKVIEADQNSEFLKTDNNK